MKYFRYFIALLLINLIAIEAYSQASAEGQNQESSSKQKALTERINLKSSDALQGVTITGTINDANGDPIPGVNVLEKGTSNGTITDVAGKFSITVVNGESVLSFSFIGFITEEIPVGDQTEISLIMVEDMIGLSEVVVVGYGTVKKSDVTGSLSSVSEEQIKEMPVTNINQAIQGRAAGVDVVNTSYGLNSKPEVRIRGNRSIKAKNDPLYVIDGIPIAGNINDINAGDIESVEILKDASATAIYGSRAGNGVVLITTKRGQSGKFSVNYEGSFTLKNSLRFFDQLSGHDWMEIARDNYRFKENYSTPYPNPAEDYDIVGKMHYNLWESVAMGYDWEDQSGTNVDNWVVRMRPTTSEERTRWGQVMDEVPDEVPVYDPGKVRTYDWYSQGRNKNALTQNHQFSVSGGTERLAAYFSLGYINEEGQGVGEKFQRISPRLNMDLQALSWLKIGMSTMFNSEITDRGEGLLWGVTDQLPHSLPYDSLGFLINPTDDINISNPIRDEQLNSREDRVNRYLGSYYAEISFTKHLKYKLNVSQDYRHWRNGRYRDGESAARYPSVNIANYSQGMDYHYAIDNLLFYNREFGIHSVGVTLLQSVERKRMERNSMKAENLPYSTQLWYRLNTTTDPGSVEINDAYNNADQLTYFKSSLASFMGRINYGLMNKYLLTASLRYDGSSIFYKDNQWDYFPSVALAWKIHNEGFLKNVGFLSQLKLRLGYGTVGQTGTDPYETAGRIKESQYVFGNIPAKGYSPELIQTRDVGWEKTATTNIGIDFGFFRNRLAGAIELYRANTYDLLLDRAIPDVTGYRQIRSNVGKTRNEGIELTINSFNIVRKDFRWETDFTFFANREEIVELADGAEEDIGNGWFVGSPVRSWYTYEYDGIWQVSDSALIDHYNETGNNRFEPGKVRVKDVDGNDTINTLDKTVVGHHVPKFSGGLTNRFYYKGFELSFFIYFRVGHGIYSRDGHYFTMNSRYATKFLVDYYKPMGLAEENANAVHPAPANQRDQYAEALFYREVSFLKVRHITLSYDFPKSWLSKIKISSLRLSVQAYNPLLFTNYPYLDPEAQGSSGSGENRIPSGTSDKGWTFSIKLGL